MGIESCFISCREPKSLNLRLLIIILLSFPAVRCVHNSPRPLPESDLQYVKTVSVVHSTGPVPVYSAGIIMPEEDIRLSFKISGIIEEIKVDEGGRVKKDQILASLNLSEITSQVQIAENNWLKTTRDHERAKRLYADSAATLEQLQNSLTAVNMAKANLDIARFNLERAVIRAPEDGIILKRLAKENEMVAAGYPVLLFGVLKKTWKIRAAVSDRDFVRIARGDSAIVMPDAWPGKELPGEVNEVSEVPGQFTGTYDIGIIFNDRGYRLAAGFMARVKIIPSAGEPVTLVPAGAVVDADSLSGYVFCLERESTVKKIKVDISGPEGDMVALKNFPAGITEVISAGAAYLHDGEKVIVLK